MRNVTSADVVVSYPNSIFFSRGKYAYFKFVSAANAGAAASLTLYGAGNSITISRILNAQGVAVFRLSSILDSWAFALNTPVLTGLRCKMAVNDWSYSGYLGLAIVGLSDAEITVLSEQSSPNNKPAARKIVIYPAFGETQLIFVPEAFDEEIELETAWGYSFYTGMGAPFIGFDPSAVEWRPDEDKYITVIGGNSYFRQNIDLDYCTDGLFVKWTDKHGIPYLYRWSVESDSEEVSSDATYSKLDDTLNPYEVNDKTLTRRFTLHSRLVDRDLFDLCKSIISGHDIQYYVRETDEWRHAMVEEGEAVDDGRILKDLVIELTDKVYDL